MNLEKDFGRYIIGTKIKLIANKENISYFKSHYRDCDPYRVYTVTKHHRAPDCVHLDVKEREAICYQRFERVYDELPEDLFTL